MPAQYLAVLIFILVGTGLVIFTFFLSRLIRPRNPYQVKNETYECGVPIFGESWTQFNNRFYIFGLIFVIFDVEAVFLFPWAVAYKSLGFFALIEMVIFIAILLVGLVYAWKKGALKWV
ncbi:MAG: NADH-quinone oxidoreductase subunit A [candidate division Zixibacteria bacterium]